MGGSYHLATAGGRGLHLASRQGDCLCMRPLLQRLERKGNARTVGLCRQCRKVAEHLEGAKVA